MPTQEELIIEYLQDADWVTANEIAEGIGQTQEETEAHLERLRENGRVDYYRSGYPLKWGIPE